jgi:hypothetical protein
MATSAAAELLALAICRNSNLIARSLSRMDHLQTNAWASANEAILTGSLKSGSFASNAPAMPTSLMLCLHNCAYDIKPYQNLTVAIAKPLLIHRGFDARSRCQKQGAALFSCLARALLGITAANSLRHAARRICPVRLLSADCKCIPAAEDQGHTSAGIRILSPVATACSIASVVIRFRRACSGVVCTVG